MDDPNFKSYLRTSLLVYGFVFISISFIITCSIILFLQNAPLEEEFIRQSAPRTFGNVFILSFVMTAVLLCMKYWFLDHPQQGQTQSLLEEHQKKLADFEADFISNVSHEMKTPLAVISNYTTLLQTSNLEYEERDKYLSIIQTQISKLSSMMTNILKLNKLEQRTYDLELKEISISEFVCQCILSFEHIWQEKNITIETDLQEPLLFVTDQQLLELVLNNLLSNAFKFTDHGGLVSVTCYRQDHELVIQVRDTGCGISDQTGRHIFERFYQGDTSHKTEGNGLGLALVRQIIDVLTGEISVSSQLGKGTTFCIHLKELC